MYDEDMRTIPRAEAQDLVPSSRLRPGAHKQVLRQEEENALELQRLGNGNIFSPGAGKFFGIKMPWERGCAFGIFGRPDNIEKVMGSSWGGRRTEPILNAQEFYNDIMQRCNQVELTLMLLTSRPLPLSRVSPAVESVLRRGMERISRKIPLEKKDEASLKDFVGLLDARRLKNGGFLTDNGADVAEGTHFIFSTTSEGNLTAEAITPGSLSQRKTACIGVTDNPLLTVAVFDAFLGPNPVDPVGKRAVGRGVLWAANGLPFNTTMQKGGKVVGVATEDGELDLGQQGELECLPPSTSLFQLVTVDRKKGGGEGGDESGGTKMLLNSIFSTSR